MIINLSDLFSQETDTFRVDKKTDNFENFPLVFGLEFGVPVKFNKTYFESTFSGFMGIGFNKEKTFRILKAVVGVPHQQPQRYENSLI